MLLAHDEKLKLHFLNVKANLKRYLRLSREITNDIIDGVPVEMQKLRDQNEALKSYQVSLSVYTSLLKDGHQNKNELLAAKVVKPNNRRVILQKVKK